MKMVTALGAKVPACHGSNLSQPMCPCRWPTLRSRVGHVPCVWAVKRPAGTEQHCASVPRPAFLRPAAIARMATHIKCRVFFNSSPHGGQPGMSTLRPRKACMPDACGPNDDVQHACPHPPGTCAGWWWFLGPSQAKDASWPGRSAWGPTCMLLHAPACCRRQGPGRRQPQAATLCGGAPSLQRSRSQLASECAGVGVGPF